MKTQSIRTIALSVLFFGAVSCAATAQSMSHGNPPPPDDELIVLGWQGNDQKPLSWRGDIYTARLLQIADLPPHRKRALADNCIVLEIDPHAAQVAANNLAAVYEEEIGVKGCVRVICTDTFALPGNADLWDDGLPVVQPNARS